LGCSTAGTRLHQPLGGCSLNGVVVWGVLPQCWVSCSSEVVTSSQRISDIVNTTGTRVWFVLSAIERTHVERTHVLSMETASLNLPILHTRTHMPTPSTPHTHPTPLQLCHIPPSTTTTSPTTPPPTSPQHTRAHARAYVRANTCTREPKSNRFPMCDVSLAAGARARDLVSRMTLAEKGWSEDRQSLCDSDLPLVAPAAV
jgi:hypothetical protein